MKFDVVVPLRNLFAFTFFILLSQICNAQQKRDVVYLKNGSIIRGTILEMTPNQSVKIETTDGSIFIYKMDEIEKTTSEEIPRTDKGRTHAKIRKISEKKIETFSPTGDFIMARLGTNLYSGLMQPGFSVSLVGGFQINENISLGVGVEATSFTYSDHSYKNNYDQKSTISFFTSNDGNTSDVTILPIFFDTRFYIPLQRVHPMFSFQVGYSTVVDRKADPTYRYTGFIPSKGHGGIYAAFGGGIRVFLTTKFSMIAEGGFSFQNLKGYRNLYNDGEENYTNKTITSLKASGGIIISLGKSTNRE